MVSEINALQEIGSCIKAIRNDYGLSLRDVAEKAGITHQSLNMIENGKCNTGINNLFKIARALDCEIVIKKR